MESGGSRSPAWGRPVTSQWSPTAIAMEKLETESDEALGELSDAGSGSTAAPERFGTDKSGGSLGVGPEYFFPLFSPERNTAVMSSQDYAQLTPICRSLLTDLQHRTQDVNVALDTIIRLLLQKPQCHSSPVPLPDIFASSEWRAREGTAAADAARGRGSGYSPQHVRSSLETRRGRESTSTIQKQTLTYSSPPSARRSSNVAATAARRSVSATPAATRVSRGEEDERDPAAAAAGNAGGDICCCFCGRSVALDDTHQLKQDLEKTQQIRLRERARADLHVIKLQAELQKLQQLNQQLEETIGQKDDLLRTAQAHIRALQQQLAEKREASRVASEHQRTHAALLSTPPYIPPTGSGSSSVQRHQQQQGGGTQHGAEEDEVGAVARQTKRSEASVHLKDLARVSRRLAEHALPADSTSLLAKPQQRHQHPQPTQVQELSFRGEEESELGKADVLSDHADGRVTLSSTGTTALLYLKKNVQKTRALEEPTPADILTEDFRLRIQALRNIEAPGNRIPALKEWMELYIAAWRILQARIRSVSIPERATEKTLQLVKERLEKEKVLLFKALTQLQRESLRVMKKVFQTPWRVAELEKEIETQALSLSKLREELQQAETKSGELSVTLDTCKQSLTAAEQERDRLLAVSELSAVDVETRFEQLQEKRQLLRESEAAHAHAEAAAALTERQLKTQQQQLREHHQLLLQKQQQLLQKQQQYDDILQQHLATKHSANTTREALNAKTEECESLRMEIEDLLAEKEKLADALWETHHQLSATAGALQAHESSQLQRHEELLQRCANLQEQLLQSVKRRDLPPALRVTTPPLSARAQQLRAQKYVLRRLRRHRRARTLAAREDSYTVSPHAEDAAEALTAAAAAVSTAAATAALSAATAAGEPATAAVGGATTAPAEYTTAVQVFGTTSVDGTWDERDRRRTHTSGVRWVARPEGISFESDSLQAQQEAEPLVWLEDSGALKKLEHSWNSVMQSLPRVEKQLRNVYASLTAQCRRGYRRSELYAADIDDIEGILNRTCSRAEELRRVLNTVDKSLGTAQTAAACVQAKPLYCQSSQQHSRRLLTKNPAGAHVCRRRHKKRPRHCHRHHHYEVVKKGKRLVATVKDFRTWVREGKRRDVREAEGLVAPPPPGPPASAAAAVAQAYTVVADAVPSPVDFVYDALPVPALGRVPRRKHEMISGNVSSTNCAEEELLPARSKVHHKSPLLEEKRVREKDLVHVSGNNSIYGSRVHHKSATPERRRAWRREMEEGPASEDSSNGHGRPEDVEESLLQPRANKIYIREEPMYGAYYSPLFVQQTKSEKRNSTSSDDQKDDYSQECRSESESSWKRQRGNNNSSRSQKTGGCRGSTLPAGSSERGEGEKGTSSRKATQRSEDREYSTRRRRINRCGQLSSPSPSIRMHSNSVLSSLSSNENSTLLDLGVRTLSKKTQSSRFRACEKDERDRGDALRYVSHSREIPPCNSSSSSNRGSFGSSVDEDCGGYNTHNEDMRKHSIPRLQQPRMRRHIVRGTAQYGDSISNSSSTMRSNHRSIQQRRGRCYSEGECTIYARSRYNMGTKAREEALLSHSVPALLRGKLSSRTSSSLCDTHWRSVGDPPIGVTGRHHTDARQPPTRSGPNGLTPLSRGTSVGGWRCHNGAAQPQSPENLQKQRVGGKEIEDKKSKSRVFSQSGCRTQHPQNALVFVDRSHKTRRGDTDVSAQKPVKEEDVISVSQNKKKGKYMKKSNKRLQLLHAFYAFHRPGSAAAHGTDTPTRRIQTQCHDMQRIDSQQQQQKQQQKVQQHREKQKQLQISQGQKKNEQKHGRNIREKQDQKHEQRQQEQQQVEREQQEKREQQHEHLYYERREEVQNDVSKRRKGGRNPFIRECAVQSKKSMQFVSVPSVAREPAVRLRHRAHERLMKDQNADDDCDEAQEEEEEDFDYSLYDYGDSCSSSSTAPAERDFSSKKHQRKVSLDELHKVEAKLQEAKDMVQQIESTLMLPADFFKKMRALTQQNLSLNSRLCLLRAEYQRLKHEKEELELRRVAEIDYAKFQEETQERIQQLEQQLRADAVANCAQRGKKEELPEHARRLGDKGQMESMQIQHALEIRTLKDLSSLELERLRQAHERELSQLQRALRAAQQDMRAELKQRLHVARLQHEAAAEQLRCHWETKVQESKQQHEQQLLQQKRMQAETLHRADMAHEQALAEEKKAFAKKMQQTEKHWEARLLDQEVQIVKERDALIARFRERLSRIEEELEQQRQEAQRLSELLQQQKLHGDRTAAELERQLREAMLEKGELQAEINRQTDELDKMQRRVFLSLKQQDVTNAAAGTSLGHRSGQSISLRRGMQADRGCQVNPPVRSRGTQVEATMLEYLRECAEISAEAADAISKELARDKRDAAPKGDASSEPATGDARRVGEEREEYGGGNGEAVGVRPEELREVTSAKSFEETAAAPLQSRHRRRRKEEEPLRADAAAEAAAAARSPTSSLPRGSTAQFPSSSLAPGLAATKRSSAVAASIRARDEGGYTAAQLHDRDFFREAPEQYRTQRSQRQEIEYEAGMLFPGTDSWRQEQRIHHHEERRRFAGTIAGELRAWIPQQRAVSPKPKRFIGEPHFLRAPSRSSGDSKFPGEGLDDGQAHSMRRRDESGKGVNQNVQHTAHNACGRNTVPSHWREAVGKSCGREREKERGGGQPLTTGWQEEKAADGRGGTSSIVKSQVVEMHARSSVDSLSGASEDAKEGCLVTGESVTESTALRGLSYKRKGSWMLRTKAIGKEAKEDLTLERRTSTRGQQAELGNAEDDIKRTRKSMSVTDDAESTSSHAERETDSRAMELFRRLADVTFRARMPSHLYFSSHKKKHKTQDNKNGSNNDEWTSRQTESSAIMLPQEIVSQARCPAAAETFEELSVLADGLGNGAYSGQEAPRIDNTESTEAALRKETRAAAAVALEEAETAWKCWRAKYISEKAPKEDGPSQGNANSPTTGGHARGIGGSRWCVESHSSSLFPQQHARSDNDSRGAAIAQQSGFAVKEQSPLSDGKTAVLERLVHFSNHCLSSDKVSATKCANIHQQYNFVPTHKLASTKILDPHNSVQQRRIQHHSSAKELRGAKAATALKLYKTVPDDADTSARQHTLARPEKGTRAPAGARRDTVGGTAPSIKAPHQAVADTSVQPRCMQPQAAMPTAAFELHQCSSSENPFFAVLSIERESKEMKHHPIKTHASKDGAADPNDGIDKSSIIATEGDATTTRSGGLFPPGHCSRSSCRNSISKGEDGKEPLSSLNEGVAGKSSSSLDAQLKRLQACCRSSTFSRAPPHERSVQAPVAKETQSTVLHQSQKERRRQT